MSSSSISVRALTADDWQEFSTLRLQALKECPGVFGSNYEREKAFSTADWQEWLSRKDGCLFGLYDAAKIIGITGLLTNRDDASGETGLMIASYIQPGYRGRGWARLLYQARVDWAVNHSSWKKIVVAHRASNEPSRRANQQAGAVYTHVVKGKTWPDGTTEDEIFYEIDLVAKRQKTNSQQKAG